MYMASIINWVASHLRSQCLIALVWFWSFDKEGFQLLLEKINGGSCKRTGVGNLHVYLTVRGDRFELPEKKGGGGGGFWEGREGKEEGLKEQKRRLEEGKKEGRERVPVMLHQVTGLIISTHSAFYILSFQSGGGKVKGAML